MARRRNVQTEEEDVGNPFGEDGDPTIIEPDDGEEFEEVDEDPGLEVAASENDPMTIDLSPAEPAPIGSHALGGVGSYGGVFGTSTTTTTPAEDVVGTPTSPPLWKAAHLHPNVQQLRVFKIVEGRDMHVGDIDAQASLNDFMRKLLIVMPKPGEEPGKFKLHPLNSQGYEIGKEIRLPDIHPEHLYLRHLRAERGGGGGSGDYGDRGPAVPAAAIPNPLAAMKDTVELLDRLSIPLQRRLEAAEVEARHSREAAAAERARLADERLEMAGRGVSTVEAMTERLMKAESERNAQAMSQTQNTFQNMLLLMNQASERERQAQLAREREEADRRERERRDAEERIRREREEAEYRRQREREEDERKRERERLEMEDRRRRDLEEFTRRMQAEREEREEFRRREADRLAREREEDRRRTEERESERARQHALRLEEMKVQAQRDREYQQQMLQLQLQRTQGDSAEGLLDKGAKILEKFGISPADAIGRFMGGGGIEEYVPVIDGLVSVATTGINNLGEYMKTKAAMDAAKATAQIAPGAQAVAAITGPSGPAMMQQPSPSGNVNEPAAPAQAVAAGPVSKLDLGIQRDARSALRRLVGQFKQLPHEKWAEAVQNALTSTVAVYHYAKEQGLKPALREAEADSATLDVLARVLAETNPPLPILTEIPMGV